MSLQPPQANRLSPDSDLSVAADIPAAAPRSRTERPDLDAVARRSGPADGVDRGTAPDDQPEGSVVSSPDRGPGRRRLANSAAHGSVGYPTGLRPTLLGWVLLGGKPELLGREPQPRA